MRRILTLYITPVIGIIIVFLHLPHSEEWLSEISPYTDIWIIGGLIVLVILNHVLTIISPLKKYERLNRQKFFILNVLLEQVNKEYEQYGISFNLLIPKRKWFFFETKTNDKGKEERHLKLYSWVFDSVWRSKNYQVNKKLKMTINQGVSGKVFKEGKACIHYNNGTVEHFGLNKQQMGLTKNLKLLFSVPVSKDDVEYADKETDTILAVLNAESESEKSIELFNNDKERKKLTDDLIRMTKICNKII